ncbi:MAG: hypothetical protein EXR05_05580 [Acetobacteraceae bacterium]|nr:hypothetical protein [Acetobacteraceae bacterium]
MSILPSRPTLITTAALLVLFGILFGSSLVDHAGYPLAIGFAAMLLALLVLWLSHLGQWWDEHTCLEPGIEKARSG